MIDADGVMFILAFCGAVWCFKYVLESWREGGEE